MIDEEARATLECTSPSACDQSKRTVLRAAAPSPRRGNGTFFPAQAFQLKDIGQLGEEKFGPILHVIRYRASKLDQVIDEINAMGYGLTFGIHSRIDAVARRSRASRGCKVGNAYVNRNMIGAVVGVQPFGGEGLSGTGPRPAARATCTASPRSARCPSTPPPPAATPR
ncbi:MAG: aldehyde dehydrogenase family protein [Arhodomonas sp.]|nr:aldehyde dehydrogenase family protein [Arhodomonas sp.]